MPTSSQSPSPAPTASASGRVAIRDLPRVDLDPALLTAICDPEQIQVDPDDGDTTISCQDAVVLGLRAASRATGGPITRIYVKRPACAGTPCSEDELSTATVFAWGAAIVAVRLDSRLDTLPPPVRLAVDPWPRPGANADPRVQREDFDSAPDVVAARTPYPYCGRAAYDVPREVFACFSDRVLIGKPAEAALVTFGTEGGEVVDIIRFGGRGALTRYRQAEGRWLQARGSLILGAPGGSAGFEAWDGDEPIE
jgi:hypothetical protein